MPTSARTSLGFFGQFADVGIRAPAQNGLLQQALARVRMKVGSTAKLRGQTAGRPPAVSDCFGDRLTWQAASAACRNQVGLQFGYCLAAHFVFSSLLVLSCPCGQYASQKKRRRHEPARRVVQETPEHKDNVSVPDGIFRGSRFGVRTID